MVLTIKDVPLILESMYSLRSEMVPCFIGAPGIGKTQGIYDFAEKKGVKVVTFILSNTVPSEVSGIRMPDRETKKLEVFDDARMASLEDGDILFFDEILEAPPMLWSSILTLVQDRIMASGRRLPDVMIVAASNKVASPSVIPPSTRDRFMWCEIGFHFNTWSEWFTKKYKHKPPEFLRNLFEEDSSEYNILTPRRFCKLWEYFSEGEETRNVIREMFDQRILDALISTDASESRQIIDSAFVIDMLAADQLVTLPEEWKNKSLKELFKAIGELEEHEQIEAALKNISI